MNPILPLQHHVPDVEARVWADGRLYTYGSYDIGGNHSYCSHALRTFSTDDLITWTDHGEIFATDGPGAVVPWSRSELFAPDCVCKDHRYYLYFCQADRGEGVAVADAPWGPFKDASPVPVLDHDAIDPAALVDDDGQAYVYWGQHHCRGARLNPDMRSIDESTLDRHLLVEDRDGFHEGACMRKVRGKYYLVYCDSHRGKASCLSYAVSDNPLGPFTKGGVIIDNDGCDPGNWNNHGSIVEFDGQWYIFYHRASQASNFNRRVCIEPIKIAADGSIGEVEMTTQGVEGPIAATREMEAVRACLLEGQVRSEPCAPAPDGTYRECLRRCFAGNRATYKYLDFGEGMTRFSAHVATATLGGLVELRLDAPDGRLVGTLDVHCTGGWDRWQQVSCSVDPVPGAHALHLVFAHREGSHSRQQVCDLERFRFEA